MTNPITATDMKQPDTAALRERLANYTPEEEPDRRIAELRDLLKEQTAG